MGGVSSQREKEETRDDRQRHILLYGDSITAGYCDNGRHFKPYGWALADFLKRQGIDCRVSICGLSGFSAAQMVDHMNSPVVSDAAGHPGKGLAQILATDGPHDLVVIMAGTNDIGSGAPATTVLHNVRRLHEVCHAHGVPTIVLAPPSANFASKVGVTKLLADWVQGSETALAYVDAEELVPRSSHELWDPDGTHLSPEGSRTFGQRMVTRILPVLAHLGSANAKKATKRMWKAAARAGA